MKEASSERNEHEHNNHSSSARSCRISRHWNFPAPHFSSNGSKSGQNPQPLVQWTEVPNHPGVVCSMTQATNNPVILMVKPDSIQVQEIKVLPAKAKIQDMVAIRHSASNSDQVNTPQELKFSC